MGKMNETIPLPEFINIMIRFPNGNYNPQFAGQYENLRVTVYKSMPIIHSMAQNDGPPLQKYNYEDQPYEMNLNVDKHNTFELTVDEFRIEHRDSMGYSKLKDQFLAYFVRKHIEDHTPQYVNKEPPYNLFSVQFVFG